MADYLSFREFWNHRQAQMTCPQRDIWHAARTQCRDPLPFPRTTGDFVGFAAWANLDEDYIDALMAMHSVYVQYAIARGIDHDRGAALEAGPEWLAWTDDLGATHV